MVTWYASTLAALAFSLTDDSGFAIIFSSCFMVVHSVFISAWVVGCSVWGFVLVSMFVALAVCVWWGLGI